MSIVELEGYPLNFVMDPTTFFDDGDAERSDYDDYIISITEIIVLIILFQSSYYKYHQKWLKTKIWCQLESSVNVTELNVT